MIFNRDICIIIFWSALVHVNFLWAERNDDHVHIKVHVPEVHQKHYHHRTVAKHHFHKPKKVYRSTHNHHHPPHFDISHSHHHDISSTINHEPEVDFSLLTAPAISKYIKWQEKENLPMTWYSDSPHSFSIPEKPKIISQPLRSEAPVEEYTYTKHKNNNNYNYVPNMDLLTKLSHQFAPQPQSSLHTSIKDFRINVENDYKKFPQKQYSNYADDNDDDDDDDQDHHNEYPEEDTDSYGDHKTESLSLPSRSPFSPQSMMIVGNDDYFHPSSSTDGDDSYSNLNLNWKQHGKRNNNKNSSNKKLKQHKRPYREEESVKMYSENSWIPHLLPNQLNEWGTTELSSSLPLDFTKIKINGRKPAFPNSSKGGGHQSSILNNDNNYETYNENEFGLSTMNEFRTRNKRPIRKSKPKWNRYIHNGSGYKY